MKTVQLEQRLGQEQKRGMGGEGGAVHVECLCRPSDRQICCVIPQVKVGFLDGGLDVIYTLDELKELVRLARWVSRLVRD